MLMITYSKYATTTKIIHYKSILTSDKGEYKAISCSERPGASAQPAYCINHRLLERCGPALHLCYTLYFSLHKYQIRFQLCIFFSTHFAV